MNLVSLFQRAEGTINFSAGDVLFKEGDPGDKMYVVLEGEVEIQVRGKPLLTATAGDLVGEMALIDAQHRSATAIAVTDCKVVPLDEKKFTFMVQQAPYFSLHVMRVLVDRLRQMDTRI